MPPVHHSQWSAQHHQPQPEFSEGQTAVRSWGPGWGGPGAQHMVISIGFHWFPLNFPLVKEVK